MTWIRMGRGCLHVLDVLCLQYRSGMQVGAGTVPWFATLAAGEVALRLADFSGRGLVFLGKLADGIPLSWQLIRGAAIAKPEVTCTVSSMPSYLGLAIKP